MKSQNENRRADDATLQANDANLRRSEESLVCELNARVDAARTDRATEFPKIATLLAELRRECVRRRVADESRVERELAVWRLLAREEPEKYARSTAWAATFWARVHYKLKQYDLSEREYNEALTAYRALFSENPTERLAPMFVALRGIAKLHFRKGRFDEAEREALEAETIGAKLGSRSKGRCVKSARRLAEKCADYAAIATQKLDELTPKRRATALARDARFDSRNGRWAEAELKLEQAALILRELCSKTRELRKRTATALASRAYLLERLERWEEAERTYLDAASFARSRRRDDALLAKILCRLADVTMRLGRSQLVVERYEDALDELLKLFRRSPKKYAAAVATTRSKLIKLYRDANRFDDVKRESDEETAFYKRLGARNDANKKSKLSARESK